MYLHSRIVHQRKIPFKLQLRLFNWHRRTLSQYVNNFRQSRGPCWANNQGFHSGYCVDFSRGRIQFYRAMSQICFPHHAGVSLERPLNRPGRPVSNHHVPT